MYYIMFIRVSYCLLARPQLVMGVVGSYVNHARKKRDQNFKHERPEIGGKLFTRDPSAFSEGTWTHQTYITVPPITF